MRTGLCLSVTFFLATVPATITRPLPAQVVLSTSTSCFPSVGMPLLPGFFLRTGSYTATIRTSYEQRLADGNVIHASGEFTRARDSSGRTMEQIGHSCDRMDEAAAGERTQVVISDPQARTSLTWIVGPRSTHIAYLRHNPDLRADIHPTRPPQLETFPKSTSARNDQTSEQLGTRTIAGLEASGMRWTRIVPAGAEGNDMPIKVVRETWTSRSPRAELMTLEDDPRTGHRMWEVTALSLSEPDPSLFTPPQGYTVDTGQPVEMRSTTGSSSSGITTTGAVSPPR